MKYEGRRDAGQNRHDEGSLRAGSDLNLDCTIPNKKSQPSSKSVYGHLENWLRQLSVQERQLMVTQTCPKFLQFLNNFLEQQDDNPDASISIGFRHCSKSSHSIYVSHEKSYDDSSRVPRYGGKTIYHSLEKKTEYELAVYNAVRLFASGSDGVDSITIAYSLVTDVNYFLNCFSVISKGKCFMSVPTKIEARQSFSKLYKNHLVQEVNGDEMFSKIEEENNEMLGKMLPSWFDPYLESTITEWLCAFLEQLLMNNFAISNGKDISHNLEMSPVFQASLSEYKNLIKYWKSISYDEHIKIMEELGEIKETQRKIYFVSKNPIDEKSKLPQSSSKARQGKKKNTKNKVQTKSITETSTCDSKPPNLLEANFAVKTALRSYSKVKRESTLNFEICKRILIYAVCQTESSLLIDSVFFLRLEYTGAFFTQSCELLEIIRKYYREYVARSLMEEESAPKSQVQNLLKEESKENTVHSPDMSEIYAEIENESFFKKVFVRPLNTCTYFHVFLQPQKKKKKKKIPKKPAKPLTPQIEMASQIEEPIEERVVLPPQSDPIPKKPKRQKKHNLPTSDKEEIKEVAQDEIIDKKQFIKKKLDRNEKEKRKKEKQAELQVKKEYEELKAKANQMYTACTSLNKSAKRNKNSKKVGEVSSVEDSLEAKKASVSDRSETLQSTPTETNK